MLAGSASTNPVLFVIALLVAFGWKTAGWIGVDRWLLPALGTPWQPGRAVKALGGATPVGPGPVVEPETGPARA